MKSLLKYLTIGVTLALGLSSCAAAERSAPRAIAVPAGSRFAAIGKVSLHRGRPCTSQIMFDFRPAHARTSVWLAAPKKESKLLTDAARHHRTVQISGAWQHGTDKICRFINVTRVTVEKGFLGIF